MTDSFIVSNTKKPDPHQDTFSKTILGFWIYLMSDCIIFATLFTTYGVLHNETFGGPAGRDLFSLKTAFMETAVLLISSVTCGFAILASVRDKKHQVLFWLALSFLLGFSFVVMEVTEFKDFISQGHGPEKSAFLSSFFTLVGTHGFHVSVGLLWMLVMMGQIWFKDITVTTFRRIVCFGMFWHFLDLVWIFIFTFVYLMGVI